MVLLSGAWVTKSVRVPHSMPFRSPSTSSPIDKSGDGGVMSDESDRSDVSDESGEKLSCN